MDEDAVARFVDITGSTAENARFFLDAAGNDVERAIESFFENEQTGGTSPPRRSAGGVARSVLSQDDEDDDGDFDDSMFTDAQQQQQQQQPQARQPVSSSGPPPPTAASAGVPPASRAPAPSSSTRPPASNSRIRTFRDIAGDDDHSDDEERQEFYAGGKASGVAVQGGPKKAQDAIGGILKAATDTGRREQEQGAPPPTSRGDAKPASSSRAFGGAGHRLGETMESTPSTSGASTSGASTSGASSSGASSSAAAAGGHAEPADDRELNHTLTFWKTGFSIDDGPLREYNDPANVQFLDEINQGRVPAELRARFGQRVNIAVQQRMQDEYVAPPKVLKPFSGHGNRLGSVDEPPSSTAAGASTSAAPAETSSASTLPLDESEPVTTLQLRLADGTRMIARFNHTHTVGDIRNFINRAKPGDAQRIYVLQTTFPNRELADPSLTLTAAGVINAVIVQRYK